MKTNRKHDPRKLAQDLLEKQGVRSAPVPVEKLARGMGVQLRFSPLDEELSGMVFIKEGTPIIGVNSMHHPNRQRFTIAHELGHLVMHRQLLSSKVHVDKQFRVLMRDAGAAAGTDTIEIEANKFAAELLLPESLINQVLTTNVIDIDDQGFLEKLAKKFKVSKQTLEYRLSALT